MIEHFIAELMGDNPTDELMEVVNDKNRWPVYLSRVQWLIIILILQMVYRSLRGDRDQDLKDSIWVVVIAITSAVDFPPTITERINDGWQ